MKRILLFCIIFLSTNIGYSFTGIYVGWQNFISPALPEDTKADSVTAGIIGTTPTRVYFYYNMLSHFIFTSGAVKGQLGWGLDIAGGIGYRFLNPAHKKSGWDLGLDLSVYLAPYFLNSENSYTETALYYGIGLGFNTLYKINPYIGVGFRVGLRYNIGTKYFASNLASTDGLIFTVGSLLTF